MFVVRDSLKQRRLQNGDDVCGKKLGVTKSDKGISSTGNRWVFLSQRQHR